MQSLECSHQKQQQQQQLLQGVVISTNSTPDSIKRSDGPWDSILRSVCRGGMFWEDIIPPKNRPVPLHIHHHSSSSSGKGDLVQIEGLNPQKRLMRVLSLSHQANLAVMIAEDHDTNTTSLLPLTAISQWTLLQTFILDAIKDIQSIFHSQLFAPSSPSSPSSSAPQQKGDDQDGDVFTAAVRQALSQDQPELAGLINLLLHIFHATGEDSFFNILFLLTFPALP